MDLLGIFGIDGFELLPKGFVPVFDPKNLEFVLVVGVVRLDWDAEIVNYGIEIEPGSSAKDRGFSTARNILDKIVGRLFELRDAVRFVGIDDIEKVVGDALHLVCGDLTGAYIEPAVYLSRIRADDLAVLCLCQIYREG